MADIRKYMFDMDFDPPTHRHAPRDLPEPEEVPEEVIDELPSASSVMFSEEELNLARDGAYEEGRQAGQAEATETTERQTAGALLTIATRMDELASRQAEANDEALRNAVRVAQAVLKKILPAACETHGFEEVTRVVEDVVGHLLDEPRIIVRVAAGLIEAVQGRLEAAAESHGFEGRVVVQADARLQPGDCRVEWTDGGAERDLARLLAEVDATIERSLAPPERRVASAEAEEVAAESAA